jgi:hypothetical protein
MRPGRVTSCFLGLVALTLAALFASARAGESKQNITERVMFDEGRYVPMWRGRLDLKYLFSYFTPSIVENSCSTKRQQCSLIPGQFYPYQQVIMDSFGDNPDQPVLEVSYPAGSWSPGSEKPGGLLNYAFPTKLEPFDKSNPLSTEGATLEYEVKFPYDFEWVKGGKLPGLMGGASNGIGCGGGNRDFDCFSYRIMWRREGYGEAYIYAPFPSLDPSFCLNLPPCEGSQPEKACNKCEGDSGYSIGRASFQFNRDSWNKMKLQMRLNTIGFSNGLLKLSVNGVTVIDRADMVWRTDPSVSIEGVNIASWYGGSSQSWAPTMDQKAYFKNFRLYYEGPTDQLARRASSSDGHQVVVKMEIDEAD